MTDSITSKRCVKEWFKDFSISEDKCTFAFDATFPITRTVHPNRTISYSLHDQIICTNVRYFDERACLLDVSTDMIDELQGFLTENEWGDPDGLKEIWNWGDHRYDGFDDEDE